MDFHRIQSHADPSSGGRINPGHVHVIRLDRVDSTNREAERRLARPHGGPPQPFLIVATIQTRGQGRRGGTTWESPPGGLWATMAYPVPEAAPITPALGLRLGLASLRTVRSVGSAAAHARLKWPNDILIEERKVCGTMGRLVSAGTERWLLAAAGINANNEIPPPLRDTATSLRKATGTEIDLDALERTLCKELCWALAARHIDPQTLAEANDALAGVGRPIRLQDGNRMIEGTLLGLGPAGTPRVRTDSGEIEASPSAQTPHPA